MFPKLILIAGPRRRRLVLFGRALSREGCVVVTAGTTAECLGLLGTFTPDVLILDARLLAAQKILRVLARSRQTTAIVFTQDIFKVAGQSDALDPLSPPKSGWPRGVVRRAVKIIGYKSSQSEPTGTEECPSDLFRQIEQVREATVSSRLNPCWGYRTESW